MKSLFRILIVLALVSLAMNVDGQIKVDLKKKLEQQVNRRLNQKADQAIDKTLDAVEDSITADMKKDGNNGNNSSGQKADAGQAQSKSAQDAGTKSEGQQETALQSYSKYDFIPGEKVIFYDDFSQDAVGDFPALWNTNGSAEVVTTNLFPGHWMKFVMNECVWTDELLKLPENYTIEYDVIPIGGLEGDGMSGWIMKLMQAKNAKAWDGGTQPGNGGFQFRVEYFGRPSYTTWLYGQECSASNLSGYVQEEKYKEKMNQKYHIAIWVQKTRVRVYQNENKIIDLPRALPTGCVKPDRIRFEYGAAMLSNFRVAVGAPDMRSKLLTEGKLVTYGIYFDVNKDVVKAESFGTISEIAQTLKENPTVRIKIIGHTDSDGDDAKNLDLSRRRALSVKNTLVNQFGIDANRIQTDGKGETEPLAPNITSESKAKNRRVEFIKL